MSSPTTPTRVRRHLPTAALLTAAIVLSATGGAVGAGMVTGAKIKNNSVTTKDLKNNNVGLADLSAPAEAQLDGVKAWARVNGTQVASPVARFVTNNGVGRYCIAFRGLNARNSVAWVVPDMNGSDTEVAGTTQTYAMIDNSNCTGGLAGRFGVRTFTRDFSAGGTYTEAAQPFYIMVG